MTASASIVDRTLDRLVAVGADPRDDQEMRLRKALLVAVDVLILPISVTWAVLYTSFGAWVGATALIYSALSILSAIVLARSRNFLLALRIQLGAMLVFPTLSMIPLGGIVPSGAVGIWGILAPIAALVFEDVRAGIRWYAAFLAIFLGAGIVGVIVGVLEPLPPAFSNLMLVLNVAVGGTFVFMVLALFAKQRAEALVALKSEHDRAESLLLNILPGSIAERLKASPTTIADQFTEASVLFADVVDFTPRSQTLSPAQVVGLLDRLFTAFDGLAERYGLEKIKTIGDAYMVAAGVPTPRADHARALALLALDMQAALAKGGALADLGLEVRIGINSGPVVAGVIGRKKFLYDLWGDAVNTASRMESAGTPNHIQVTQATCELLRDEFELEPRGSIAVKGKGEMETWYLVALKPVAS